MPTFVQLTKEPPSRVPFTISGSSAILGTWLVSRTDESFEGRIAHERLANFAASRAKRKRSLKQDRTVVIREILFSLFKIHPRLWISEFIKFRLRWTATMRVEKKNPQILISITAFRWAWIPLSTDNNSRPSLISRIEISLSYIKHFKRHFGNSFPLIGISFFLAIWIRKSSRISEWDRSFFKRILVHDLKTLG